MPMTIDRKAVPPARQPNRPTPIRLTPFPVWYWFYFALGCALFNLCGWTTPPVTLAMQWETLPVSSGQTDQGNYCKLALCKRCTPRFKAPAGHTTDVCQWIWNHPMETESPNTESSPLKCTFIAGVRPSTITVSGQFSPSANRIISRLYLQKKSLLY